MRIIIIIIIHRDHIPQQKGLDPESLMFRDGRRKIDMVICYEEESEGVMTEIEAKRREMRKTFLENLIKDGLELEIEDKTRAFDEKTYFVKIHLPWRSETRFAEVLNMKLPVKRFITISVKAWVWFNYYYLLLIQFKVIITLFLTVHYYLYIVSQDEDKNSVRQLSLWRKFVKLIRKMNAYHELVVDSEATFSNANQNGNPEEQ